MKLAMIVPGGFDRDRPANTIPALVSLTAELAARHELHVFAFGGPGPVTHYDWRGARVHQLGDAGSVDPPGRGRGARMLGRFAWQLARELRRAAPFDLLHAFWVNEPALLAGVFGAVGRRPVVATVGGGEAVWLADVRYGGAGSAARRALVTAALALADELTVGSAFARGFLPARSAGRARAIPLGVDCTSFHGPIARPDGPPWRLLHVGSLTPVKDHERLLAAFARVRARLGAVTLDCVGEDARAGAIHARARALGLGDDVRFHGLLPNDEVAALFRRAHLHLITSRYESQSVVLLEAAAAGLPTVGTAVGLVPELALAGAAIAVTEPGPPALGDAISALLGDEARRHALGRAAQRYAQTHDVGWTARAFEELYRQLATRTPSKTGETGETGERESTQRLPPAAPSPATATATATASAAPMREDPRAGVATVWLTGRPASGKTALATAVADALRSRSITCQHIDGDELRRGLSRALGFGREDRRENARRATDLALAATTTGSKRKIAIVSLVSPYAADRAEARRRHEALAIPFLEVHVECPLTIVEERDPKGLYRAAREGRLVGMTGIDDPYEPPAAPDLLLDTSELTVEDETRRVLDALRARAVIS